MQGLHGSRACSDDLEALADQRAGGSVDSSLEFPVADLVFDTLVVDVVAVFTVAGPVAAAHLTVIAARSLQPPKTSPNPPPTLSPGGPTASGAWAGYSPPSGPCSDQLSWVGWASIVVLVPILIVVPLAHLSRLFSVVAISSEYQPNRVQISDK